MLAWRNALLAVFALCGVAMGGWMARMPAVKQALAIDTAQTGLLILGLAVGSIVGLLLAGPLLNRFPSRTVIAVSIAGMGTGLLVAGVGATLSPSFWVTYGGFAILGASLGACDVAMNVSGALNERALDKTFLPVLHAFFSFGALVGAGVGALTEFAALPLLVHAVVLAGAVLLVGALYVRHLQSEPVGSSRAPESRVSLREIWGDPRTYFIGLIVLGMGFAEGSANDWLSLAMVDGHGTDNTTGAIVFGVFVGVMTVGRLLGGRVVDRFGRVLTLQVSSGLAATGLALFIFVPDLVIALIGVVLWGLGSALGFPLGMSAAADDPRTASARVSAVALVGYCAFLIGPPTLGLLGEQLGILPALTVVLALIVVAGLASPAARKPLPTRELVG